MRTLSCNSYGERVYQICVMRVCSSTAHQRRSEASEGVHSGGDLVVQYRQVGSHRSWSVSNIDCLLQADEARRQAEAAEQQSAEQRFLELQQKAQEEQAK